MDTTQSATNKSIADKTTLEALRDELAAANTYTENPEAQQHLDRALDLARELPPTPLVECPVCEKVGLPERINNHDCESGHVH